MNNERKRKFRSKYKEKIISIGDSVRMHSPATKVGLKFKVRGDIWKGPLKVIGKLPNGNLKLGLGNGKNRTLYIRIV